MKQKPRWTLEMLTASLAVLCGLLVLVLLIQRPTAWPALLALVVLWGVVVVLFRCQLRKWVARWMCGGSFEGSKLQFSLEPLSQPAALLSGETVLWYNAQFRTRLLNGQDALVNRVQKVLPGLDLQQCRKQEGQLLTLADGMWSVHSSTVPGDAESMTLLVLNEETALRKVEAEYKASRPGYLVFLVDGYDDVFGDMLDSERARLLEGINRTLEDMIGRGSGFLRRVASGRYIAVVEERQMEQFANRGYDVLDKIRALDPSVNLSLSIGIGRGAKTLREAQDMAVQALDMAQGRGGDQAAEMTPDGFTFYHAGDTGLFSSMELIGSLYPLDLALLPVGGFFTMDGLQAAHAARLLKPKAVIPMHWGTFPVLAKDTSAFASHLASVAPDVRLVSMTPGDSAAF